MGLAAKMTEAQLISRTEKRKFTAFTIEGRITTTDTLKYLGVTQGSRLTFKEHLTKGTDSIKNGWSAYIMPNIGDSKQPRRALLASMVTSVIRYGVPIWSMPSARSQAMAQHG